jgi:hypothetical protein
MFDFDSVAANQEVEIKHVEVSDLMAPEGLGHGKDCAGEVHQQVITTDRPLVREDTPVKKSLTNLTN